MKSKMVKGIFFDAGDTLFEAAKPIGQFYSQTAEKYGVKVNTAFLDQRFKVAFKEAPPLSFPGVTQKELESLEYHWWKNIVSRVFDGIDFPAFDPFFEAALYDTIEVRI